MPTFFALLYRANYISVWREDSCVMQVVYIVSEAHSLLGGGSIAIVPSSAL